MSLLRRWADGEKNPWADADWSTRWKQMRVTEQEWRELLREFQVTSEKWSEVLRTARPVDPAEFTGLIGTVVHLAYHIGAIRQIDRATRGPASL
jgi:hypothetical protein